MFQEANSEIIVYYLAGSLLVFILVAAIVVYVFLHQKKVLQFRTQLHAEEIRKQQAVFDALQEGEEKERTRLAEELHDGIGAKLSGLKMNLEYLKSIATDNSELINKIFLGVAETLDELREISHNLQPYFFNDKDLEQLLLHYIEQLSSPDGCRYDLFMSSPIGELDKRTKFYCYRILVELLHNIHKHAKASFASVQVNVEYNRLELIVEDNGIGFSSNPQKINGIGLINIRNRLDVYKGTINIDSSEKGTSIIIGIPLNLVS